MITREAPTNTLASPLSKANAAPSDSEAQAASPDVVDVTDGEAPWTVTSARLVFDPPPLRTSKRALSKHVSNAELVEARKGKKKATKHPSAAATSAGAPKKNPRVAPRDSDSESEEKAPPPASKKAKKAPVAVLTSVAEAPRAAAPSRADQGFDLTVFMATFQPGTASTANVPSTVGVSATTTASREQETPSVAAELRALRDEVIRLRRLVRAQGTADGNIPFRAAASALNARGELPPTEVCHLTSSSFPEGSKKAKGDYNPPQAHMLAAGRMFRSFGTATGKPLSAMSFVLWMRELDCVKFQVTPAVLMAISSGRLGSRDLVLMHFKEATELATLEDGSSNANFSSNFSPSAALPTANSRCSTYEDILDAIHGLTTLGQEVWYDHIRKLTSRLRAFIAKKKSSGPANTPARVRLTLLYANNFIGTALDHMQADDTQWWPGFCETLRAIDYQSPQWTMALLSVLTQVAEEERAQSHGHGRRGQESRREKPRRPAIPDSIHRLIPLNRQGKEPCLLNIAGLPCSDGSRDRCGNPRRVHNWRDELPDRVQEWIDRTYGMRSTNQGDRR